MPFDLACYGKFHVDDVCPILLSESDSRQNVWNFRISVRPWSYCVTYHNGDQEQFRCWMADLPEIPHCNLLYKFFVSIDMRFTCLQQGPISD